MRDYGTMSAVLTKAYLPPDLHRRLVEATAMVEIRTATGTRHASVSELLHAATERMMADLSSGGLVVDVPSLLRSGARQRVGHRVVVPIETGDLYHHLGTRPTPEQVDALKRDADRILVGDRIRVRGTIFSAGRNGALPEVGTVGTVERRWGTLAIVKVGQRVYWLHAFDVEPEVTQ